MSANANQIIATEEFRSLTATRWLVAATLTLIMLGAYFGFILVLAFDKALLSGVLGDGLTVGIPVGLGIILLAWALTGIYVFWANNTYDATVASIRQAMKRSE